jgi:hypothetical protein
LVYILRGDPNKGQRDGGYTLPRRRRVKLPSLTKPVMGGVYSEEV